MKYYFYVENDKIVGKGQAKCLNLTCVEVTQEIYNDYEQDKYIYENGEIVLNPQFAEIKAREERERIGNLTCTKRVFALMLQEMGISYTQLKELIATSEQAQLEWDLCVELERKNPLLDVMAGQLGVTSEQLDKLFLYANGEITENEVKTNNSETVSEQSE